MEQGSIRRLRLTGLPQIKYAEEYESARYDVTLSPKAGHMTVLLLLEGTLDYRAGESCHVLRAGDVCLVLGGECVKLSASKRHKHLSLHAAVDFSLCEEDALPVFLPVLRQPRDAARIRTLMQEIHRICTLEPTQTLGAAGHFLLLLSALDTQARALQNATTRAEEEYVRGAKAYVYAHVREPLRQRDVAAHLGITPEYLCAVFKKAEHLPLVAFANRTKLQHVRALMEKEGLPLHEAAAHYGFTDPNYASRLYRKYFGESITGALQKGK